MEEEETPGAVDNIQSGKSDRYGFYYYQKDLLVISFKISS